MADDMVKMVSPGVSNVHSTTRGYQYTVIFGNEHETQQASLLTLLCLHESFSRVGMGKPKCQI